MSTNSSVPVTKYPKISTPEASVVDSTLTSSSGFRLCAGRYPGPCQTRQCHTSLEETKRKEGACEEDARQCEYVIPSLPALPAS